MHHTYRRVVTGHDVDGRAVVMIDELKHEIPDRRPGVGAQVIWSTVGFPVDNEESGDLALREVATSETNGTIFRLVSYAPGAAPRNHRTESIDYAVVLSGEIDMELDGVTVHLSAGDLLVQRGTIHNWVNRGKENCVIAFVLIGAKPVNAGGKSLTAIG
ncbi:cupin domain-containing protein [uncultured Pigmentiphaga sp.]|jgi:Mannose-6-phosphate isomerase|uniref:cupin domain-containing protein n=1 Tax=uncultured Pigmentiphaga sp. TaxID=340361 RepID=UPI00262E46ED|nr:cupin domain-containing protein [uncultured Pigmentiphaga sp.]